MSDIRMVTSTESLDNLFARAAEIIYKCILNEIAELGEACKNRIRDRSRTESWIDQTGNLRSSIGYAIYSYGQKQIESAFEQVLGGQEGSSKGRKLVSDLASKYAETYALVVVAAMDYADFVEAIDSKDVLASTEIWAKQEVSKNIKRALKEAESEIQKLEVSI